MTETYATKRKPIVNAIGRKTREGTLVPTVHSGGCLCGAIRFEATGPAERPHTCSCGMCQRHTGAPTAAWVEFARDRVVWVGSGGAPATFRSSEVSSRAFCATCGSSLGAIDDAPVIALLIGTFDEPGREDLRPRYHAFEDGRPPWWNLDTGPGERIGAETPPA